MALHHKQEPVIRRLLRESEARLMTRHAGDLSAAVDTDASDVLVRLNAAATEMNRLRTLVASQQNTIYDQKRQLADVRRDLARALSGNVDLEQSLASEKARAGEAVEKCDRLAAEANALRKTFGMVTAAVNRSFDRTDNVIPLNVVA